MSIIKSCRQDSRGDGSGNTYSSFSDFSRVLRGRLACRGPQGSRERKETRARLDLWGLRVPLGPRVFLDLRGCLACEDLLDLL